MNSLLNDNIKELQHHITENYNLLVKKKQIKQADIIKKCSEAGYSISQSTLSNTKNGKGNLTLSNLLAIAYALDVSIFDLISPAIRTNTDSTESAPISFDKLSQNELFIRNPESVFMKSYIGEYHIMFFKTSGFKDSVVEGNLRVEKSQDGSKCEATLKFLVDETDKKTGKPAEKIYKGELIISQAMRAVYCYLINEQIGEMCMLIFQHIYTSYSSIETAMAIAVTTASGSNRRPTAHRMVISRSPITDNVKESVKGQLLMNTADIYLSKQQLKSLLNSPELPDSFKDLLKKYSSKCECYCFPEALLYDESLTEKEQLNCISYIRANSKTPRYNKISRKTDETLYTLLSKSND